MISLLAEILSPLSLLMLDRGTRRSCLIKSLTTMEPFCCLVAMGSETMIEGIIMVVLVSLGCQRVCLRKRLTVPFVAVLVVRSRAVDIRRYPRRFGCGSRY